MGEPRPAARRHAQQPGPNIADAANAYGYSLQALSYDAVGDHGRAGVAYDKAANLWSRVNAAVPCEALELGLNLATGHLRDAERPVAVRLRGMKALALGQFTTAHHEAELLLPRGSPPASSASSARSQRKQVSSPRRSGSWTRRSSASRPAS